MVCIAQLPYLTDVLPKIPASLASCEDDRLDELLPDRWQLSRARERVAAFPATPQWLRGIAMTSDRRPS